MGRSDKSTVKLLGTFLGSVFLCAGLISFFSLLFHYKYTIYKSAVNPLTLFSLLIGILFYVTTFFKDRRVYKFQTLLTFIGGLFIVSETTYSLEVHGEVTIILSFMLLKIYGLARKKTRFIILYSSIFLAMLIRLNVHWKYIQDNPWTFIYYITACIGFTLFFLLIVESREEKITEEAVLICEQWTKEQVYNDIGRSVFSTFMHDYHIDHAIVHLENLEDMLKEGYVKESIELVKELQNLLSDDSENIIRIKEKIRLSEKDKPERIDACTMIEDKVRYYKRAYKLTDSEIECICEKCDEYKLFMSPIDFSGILENLLKNAIEATHGLKRIVVSYRINSKGVSLSIVNRGKAIPWRKSDGTVPPESFRVGRTTKSKGSGWGVYSIIKRVYANNGDIKITSKEDETEFRLLLPVKKVEIFQRV